MNDYTWIPGDDHTEYLSHLERFPQPIRYYGALPAKLLPFSDSESLRIYYYLTPLLVFLGLYFVLRRYGPWVPLFAFIILFFVTPVILQDMEAGTFVGILGFYIIFLPSLHYICKSNPNRYIITFLLLFGALFHTTTGTFLMLGYLFLIRKPKDVLPLLPSIVVVVVWGVFFDGSTAQILQATNYTYTPPMRLDLFLKQYLGITTLTLLALTFLFCYNTTKLKMFQDRFILTLCVMSLVFFFLAFFPYFHVNSDRLSKFLVGLMVIILTVCFAKAYKITTRLNPEASLYIDLGIIATTTILLYNTFNDQFKFWLSLGV